MTRAATLFMAISCETCERTLAAFSLPVPRDVVLLTYVLHGHTVTCGEAGTARGAPAEAALAWEEVRRVESESSFLRERVGLLLSERDDLDEKCHGVCPPTRPAPPSRPNPSSRVIGQVYNVVSTTVSELIRAEAAAAAATAGTRTCS